MKSKAATPTTSNEMTRRSFLGAAALAGAAAAAAGLAGCAPVQAAKEADAEGDGSQGKEREAIPEDAIADTKECDVVVVGLGVAGVAAMRAAAEGGANVIAVEKTSIPNCRSGMFAAFNSDLARKLGVQEVDPTVVANELMIQMAHRGNYRVINTWLARCGEAFEWYAGAMDDLMLVGLEDPFPEDPNQIYLYGDGAEDTYRFGIDHERLFPGCISVGGGNETHRPLLEANIDKAVGSGNALTVFDSPAVQLDVEDGRVTGVVCQNLADDTYTRYRASKGVILATGDYSLNEDMLKTYAPWIFENRDKYLFSHEARDMKGNPASTGDGQIMGVAAGGHLDCGPHAVMAHILQFGADQFLEVNEHGRRFCNEDLSMTNIAKIMVAQPGTKVFQIVDARAADYYPQLDMTLEYIRSFGDGETYSAEADTLEELAAQLNIKGEDAKTFLDEVARYNELCEKGHDDDFGKAAEKMHPIVEGPFRAITYDMSKHTSVDDVSCMRLLVTMGGLETDEFARVLGDDLRPIPGLYAVGNTQGGRFVDDYPFSLSGASHGAALTYGYIAGQHIAA